MKFEDSQYGNLIGKIPMAEIARELFVAGYRQVSSKYCAVQDQSGNRIDGIGPALLNAIRHLVKGDYKISRSL